MSIVLFLPRDPDDPWQWLRVADGRVVARGEGLPEIADAPVTAVPPAESVTLHWAELPDRSPAQATAAARLLVAEASAASVADLHVAVGREPEGAERPIGVVSAEPMERWLALLAAQGIDPVALVPAPLLMPRPAEGWLRAELPGGAVVRGPGAGFADEPALTALVTGAQAPETLEPDALDAAIAAAAAEPPLNLRQGAFARRTRRAVDWALVRKLAVLVAVILAVTVAIDLVRLARYSIDASRAEAETERVARLALPRGSPQDGDPERLLGERLARLRGPGLGFTRMSAAVFAAVRDAGGSDVTRIAFDPVGELRVGLATDGEAKANAVKQALEAAGFEVTASPFAASGTRLNGELTVRAP